MHSHLSHLATSIYDAEFQVMPGKKRGSYACGRCGLPKKGHKCLFTKNDPDMSIPVTTPASRSAITTVTFASVAESTTVKSPSSVTRTLPPPRRRRCLSFDDITVVEEDASEMEWNYPEVDPESGKLPMICLWDIFRRFPPAGLLEAARVCRGWREATRKIWRVMEELRIRIPPYAQIGFVGSILQKCSGLVKLSLRMESDVDATMLACIAFSCCNLRSLEISMSGSSINWIIGDELCHFIAEKRGLTSLKLEGCRNLGGVMLSSTTMTTLWLSDLHLLSKMVFNCPNLKEISLDFSRQGNDSTDLVLAMDALGRSCPKLQNLHIASVCLSNAAVLALTAANLRGLRMLSLVLGSEVTDASVAAIASSFSKLELLDLSGRHSICCCPVASPGTH